MDLAQVLYSYRLTRLSTETNVAEIANSADPDEVAHNEPHHLDLHCVSSWF